MNNSVRWYSAIRSNCNKVAWLNASPKRPDAGGRETVHRERTNMQAIIGAMILAAGLGLASVSNAVAAPVGIDVRDAGFPEGLVEQAQYGGGGYCQRLRRACIYKEQRGEVGEGNCRRYRQECGGRASYCERLRRACIYKEERGEVGEGNCRRYRNECGR
jgi:hypothetical protein